MLGRSVVNVHTGSGLDAVHIASDLRFLTLVERRYPLV